jgi:hypothetical protein
VWELRRQPPSTKITTLPGRRRTCLMNGGTSKATRPSLRYRTAPKGPLAQIIIAMDDGWDSHGRHRIPTHRSIVVTADFSRRQTRIFQDLFCVIAHTSKDQSDRLSERALDRYLI